MSSAQDEILDLVATHGYDVGWHLDRAERRYRERATRLRRLVNLAREMAERKGQLSYVEQRLCSACYLSLDEAISTVAEILADLVETPTAA